MKSIYTEMRFKLMNSGCENWSWGREQGDGDSAAPERCGEGTVGWVLLVPEDKALVLKTCPNLVHNTRRQPARGICPHVLE